MGKSIGVTLLVIATLSVVALSACGSGANSENQEEVALSDQQVMADELEVSLFDFIVESWYPRIIDTIHGGYISDLNYDWTLTESSQKKALVQQSRHVWSTSFIYEAYPHKKEFLESSAYGFSFLRNHMWDKELGGFYAFCNKDGTPDAETIHEKLIYGQSFAVYGLSQYARISNDLESLELAKTAFLWMDEHARDQEHGGFFEVLNRDGSPVRPDENKKISQGDSPGTGLKDYNSSIHLMEAFTELYRVWPDSLVRARLEEMFYLIRDTFVHPDGFLQLYFYPDWTLVSDESMHQMSGGNHNFTQHYTYGHDVETAYLLLETAHLLGWGEDEKTHQIAKGLVDHSLESGWDKEVGGFYNAGKEYEGEIRIINDEKSWWSQIEGLNALILMYSLYPDDPYDYFGLAKMMWEYMDTFLIDKENGGWYNRSLDISPGSKTERKSHAWKTTYHSVRGMVNCITMLRKSGYKND